MTRQELWALRELTRYLEVVAHNDNDDDGHSALAEGLSFVLDALGASAGAVVTDRTVRARLGFESVADEKLVAQLRVVIEQASDRMVVPGVGSMHALAVDAGIEPPCSMVVVRSGEPFVEIEHLLARGVGRALSSVVSANVARAERRVAIEALERQQESCERQAAENGRLLAALKERQALLERLARIQRSISVHAPLSEVYAAIVEGARELLDVEVIGLRHLDTENPEEVVMVAHRGMSDATLRVVERQPVTQGIGGRAIVEGRLIVAQNYAAEADRLEVFLADGVHNAMSAPIHAGGRVVGSLTVGSTQAGRRYSDAEQEILMAFAEHASLALTDAQTLAAVDDALHDPLTKLPGRTLFFDRLNHVVSGIGRTALSFGMIFIDLDGFKRVNDRFGHAGGDQLLAETASRIRLCLRDADTAARLGGDEFGVLVEQVLDLDAVVATAERIARAMAEPIMLLGTEVKVTAGIGVALSTPELSDGDELVRRADMAMYRSKRSGGDCVVAYDHSMSGQGQLS